MATRGQPFGSGKHDYDNLRVDGSDLYWHDKKVVVGGWTRAEKLSLLAIVCAALVALAVAFLVNFESIEKNIRRVEEKLCVSHTYFCPATPPTNSPQAPQVVK